MSNLLYDIWKDKMLRTIVRDEILESDLIAIIDDKGYKVTYKELADKARNMSQYFEERSLIFFLCDHHTETIELLYISTEASYNSFPVKPLLAKLWLLIFVAIK